MYRFNLTRSVITIVAVAFVCSVDPVAGQEALLPSQTVPGYARILRGEDFAYHSPLRARDRSLLVRSLNREYSIVWESAEVPDDLAGDTMTFVVMAAIDVREETYSFDLFVDGEHALTFRNPEVITGDNLIWPGSKGVSARFRISEIDRYGDAMGFMFISVPRGRFSGRGPVRFEVRGESADDPAWFMVFQEIVRPNLSLRNAPAVLRSEGGESQTVRVDVLSLVEESTLGGESGIARIEEALHFGINRLSIRVASVDSTTSVPLSFTIDGHEISLPFELEPVHRMDLYLLHHTHVDIGYTHHQDDVERIQWENLESALEIGERTQNYPEEAQFVWNPESIWALDTYLREHPDRADRMLDAIRKGWIEPNGLYGNLLTGLASSEALMRSMKASRRIAEQAGISIRSEMLSDIPGFTWGLVPVLALHGIKYLSIGPNFGHRIGSFMERLADRPFYWESPSGRERVLTWVSGGGYAWFHTGLGFDRLTRRLDDENVFAFLDQLEEADYPYDISYLRYNVGSDNGPTDPTLPDAVRDWNEKYLSPRLIISGTTEAFEAFESRYGASLPVLKGDMTGYWEDGAASSALETSLVRRAGESLIQTEALAAILGVDAPERVLTEAWRNVSLYNEHTWGSWDSISDPESEFTRSQWERKASFGVAADSLARVSRSRVVEDAEDTPGSVNVFNTLNWERTGLVELPPGVSALKTEEGDAIPVQRLSSGENVFLASRVPAFGSRRFEVATVSPVAITPIPADPFEFQTDTFAIRIESTDGSLRSLVYLPLDLQMVDPSSDSGLNEYLYVVGRSPDGVRHARQPGVRVKEWGPVVKSVEISLDGPGAQSPLLTEIRFIDGIQAVEIINFIDKEKVYEPEAVLYRFPFAVSDPEIRIDVPWGSFEPESEQIPGSSKNYFSVQRWIDVHNDERGVTMTSLDAPLVQIGGLHTDATVTGWLDRIEPSATVYSYVMNNYWETNFRATQDGPHTFRYTLRPHEGFVESEAERFALEVTQPLLAVHDTQSSGLPFRVDADQTVVTLLKRTGDADSFIARLYNPSPGSDRVQIAAMPGSTIRVYRSDVWERRIQPIDSRLELGPYQIETIVVERTRR